MFVEFTRQRGLAAGRAVQGVRGGGRRHRLGRGRRLLLLERLSDARAQRPPGAGRGPRLGGQPGRRVSNGLTAPNGPSQQRVIRQALANAGLTPGRRGRGGGARHRDHARATRSRRRRCWPRTARTGPTDRPLWLGSLKSNIGHTQAAAGVAGVIKMVMAMRHGVLPADPARRRADAARGLDSGDVRAADRAGRVAGGRPAAPRGGVLLRHQRHQRPRDPGTGPGGPTRGRRRRRRGRHAERPGAGALGAVGA